MCRICLKFRLLVTLVNVSFHAWCISMTQPVAHSLSLTWAVEELTKVMPASEAFAQWTFCDVLQPHLHPEVCILRQSWELTEARMPCWCSTASWRLKKNWWGCVWISVKDERKPGDSSCQKKADDSGCQVQRPVGALSSPPFKFQVYFFAGQNRTSLSCLGSVLLFLCPHSTAWLVYWRNGIIRKPKMLLLSGPTSLGRCHKVLVNSPENQICAW